MSQKTTVLYDTHKKLNANIIDFHGVLLPVFYSSIQEEHNAVRNNIGIFDVSHMGNILLTFNNFLDGVDALNYLLPNDYSKIVPGKIIYSPLLNENGTVIDDLMVSCLSETKFHIIVNASNIEKDFNWIKEKLEKRCEHIDNISDESGIIAVQGPNAVSFLDKEFDFEIGGLSPFTFAIVPYNNTSLMISRTGYTGEDGVEIVADNHTTVKLFNEILEKGKAYNILPCGLGARDTLRLEAGLPLYGQEFDENHSPLQSMMKWSIKMNKPFDFIGKEALKNRKDSETMIGFEVLSRSIPRTDMEIINSDGEKVGNVTSGTFSPTLKKNIGIAYIKDEYANSDNLKIKIRNKIEDIQIIKLPFYKRNK